MDKIPTAEEFALSDKWERVIDHVTIKRMKDFAQLHVKAALEAAAKNANIIDERDGDSGEGDFYIDKKTILNSYPESNIK